MGKMDKFLLGLTDGLLVAGAINWGLVGVLKFDFVGWFAGIFKFHPAWIYIPVGIAGLYKLYDWIKG